MTRRRRSKPAAPAAEWTNTEIVQLATLVGGGASMAALVTALGRSADSIRGRLRHYGLSLAARSPGDVAAVVVFDRATWGALTGHAAARGVEPEWFAAAMLRELRAPAWGQAFANLAESVATGEGGA